MLMGRTWTLRWLYAQTAMSRALLVNLSINVSPVPKVQCSDSQSVSHVLLMNSFLAISVRTAVLIV